MSGKRAPARRGRTPGAKDAEKDEPLFAGVSFDPGLYYEEIRRAAEELRCVLDRIGESQREVERAYLYKKEKTKLYDRIFLREARGFADWCRLVGRDELAERIRPSSSRPGRTEKEPPAEPPSSDLASQVREPPLRFQESTAFTLT